MNEYLTYAATLARQLRFGVRQRLHPDERSDDAGIGTLEMVILALGLMAIAGILVAALTVAITRRSNQLK